MEQRRQSASDWVRIPAALRYDRRLSAKAKLLYGEIEALACRTGYCHAHNGYFCERLGMSDRTVTRLLAELTREGYLRLEVRRGPDRQVLERRIFPGRAGEERVPPPDRNDGTPPDKIDGTPPDKNGGESKSRKENIPPEVPQEGDGVFHRSGRRKMRGARRYHLELIDGEEVVVYDD